MGLEPTTSWTTTRGYHQLSYGHRVPSGYRYQQAVAEVELIQPQEISVAGVPFARFDVGAEALEAGAEVASVAAMVEMPARTTGSR